MKLVQWSLLLASATASADAVDDVRCREIGFSRAAESRDLSRFAAFIDTDARFVNDTVLRGPEEIADAWQIFMSDDGPAIKWRPQFVEVLEDGRLALTRGPYRMRVTNDDGTETEYWGTFNSVWRLHDDDEWRVVFDAGGAAADPPPAEVRDLLDAEDDCAE